MLGKIVKNYEKEGEGNKKQGNDFFSIFSQTYHAKNRQNSLKNEHVTAPLMLSNQTSPFYNFFKVKVFKYPKDSPKILFVTIPFHKNSPLSKMWNFTWKRYCSMLLAILSSLPSSHSLQGDFRHGREALNISCDHSSIISKYIP